MYNEGSSIKYYLLQKSVKLLFNTDIPGTEYLQFSRYSIFMSKRKIK
nr:MAG TPA: hypothetical protein [Caudoviricetes sp.]